MSSSRTARRSNKAFDCKRKNVLCITAEDIFYCPKNLLKSYPKTHRPTRSEAVIWLNKINPPNRICSRRPFTSAYALFAKRVVLGSFSLKNAFTASILACFYSGVRLAPSLSSLPVPGSLASGKAMTYTSIWLCAKRIVRKKDAAPRTFLLSNKPSKSVVDDFDLAHQRQFHRLALQRIDKP